MSNGVSPNSTQVQAGVEAYMLWKANVGNELSDAYGGNLHHLAWSIYVAMTPSECVPAESVRALLADAPSPTPRTDELIAKLDLEPESRLVFVIRQIVNHAKDLERQLDKALCDPPQIKSIARD